ncbi:MAG: DUF3616 domain-containing protein [bacterium]
MLVTALGCMGAARRADAAGVELLGVVSFTGALPAANQLSAVARVGKFLIVGGDEGHALGVLAPTGDASIYRAVAPIQLPGDDESEIDIEGLATSGDTLFVVGSHSLKRKKVDADTYVKNRKRLAEVKVEPTRDALYRLRVDPQTGTASLPERISLRPLLTGDPILQRFTTIPSKENGIDIEGLAVADGRLYVGFRGPVLRGGYVPVAVLSFDAPQSYELRFVPLNGDGIRDLARVRDGLLILSGRVGDGAGAAHIYFWNGKDAVPGSGGPGGALRELGELPSPNNAKPEGMLVMDEGDDAYTVLVVYDGAAAGAPALFKVPKPQPPL